LRTKLACSDGSAQAQATAPPQHCDAPAEESAFPTETVAAVSDAIARVAAAIVPDSEALTATESDTALLRD